jgi:hypothetical protein
MILRFFSFFEACVVAAQWRALSGFGQSFRREAYHVESAYGGSRHLVTDAI